MQYAGDLEAIFTCDATEEKMARLLDSSRGRSHVVPTEVEMVCECSRGQFWASLTSDTSGISSKIVNCLYQQRFISPAASFTELPMSPGQNFFKVLLSG